MYSQEKPWNLYYWNIIQGRGEFVRLIFEDLEIPYVDVERKPNSKNEKLLELWHSKDHFPMLSPPFIERDGVFLNQTFSIVQFLSKKYGKNQNYYPTDEVQEAVANQIAHAINDLVVEAHDTHHPINVSQYYEEQKEEAIKRAKFFCASRLSKFCKYFENVLDFNKQGKSKFLIGNNFTYVDTLLFQVISGILYAFPKSMEKIKGEIPLVLNLVERVAQKKNIANYLKSDKRLKFNEMGIFRQIPELDQP